MENEETQPKITSTEQTLVLTATMPEDKLPRGVRNRNPGNIVRDKTEWEGMAADQSSDDRFVVFDDATFGIRALIKILLSYQDVHGLKTIGSMIDRWAPPNENNSMAYVEFVSGRVGISSNQLFDMRDPTLCRAVTAAIIAQENANYIYPETVMIEAMSMAGIIRTAPNPVIATITNGHENTNGPTPIPVPATFSSKNA